MNKYSPLISEFGSAEEEAAYDAWFRAKVAKSMADKRPGIPHDEVMAQVRATLEKTRVKRAAACDADQLCYSDDMNKYSPIVSEFESAEEEAAYDVWFREQVKLALADDSPGIPHDEVMAEMRAIVERARAAKA